MSGAAFGDYTYTLYELQDDGELRKISGTPDDLHSRGAQELTVVGDKLYLVGDDSIDDGFGGTQIAPGQLFVMDTGEHFTRLTGPGTPYPHVTNVADLFAFTIDVPDPIRGGAGNDHLAGTAGKDEIFGLAGNDTLAGGAGDDRLDGGTGAD